MSKINVLIVGLGRVGGKFFRELQLLGAEKVTILGVCEPNENNPLLIEAKTKGINCYADYSAGIRELGEQVDVIMDTSNSDVVKKGMRDLMQETNNHHSVIVPMSVNYLMWHLLPNAETIEHSDHKNIGY